VIPKELQFTFAIAVLCLSTFVPHSFAQPDNRFYVKGIADDGPFAGQYVRILGDEKQATIIRAAPQGMAIIRVDLYVSALCYDIVPTTCFNGVVTSTKNTDSPDIGDIIRLNIDTSGKNQVISFLTGIRAGSVVSIKDTKDDESGANIQKSVFIPEKRDMVTLANFYEDDEMTQAIQKARQFTISHPTFAFDGIRESLDINLVSIIQTKVPVYIVQVIFDSDHPGYGKRTGQVLSEVPTHHAMIVMVSGNEIGSAIVDGIWDEFNQNWQK
jgi:hypothetical protein